MIAKEANVLWDYRERYCYQIATEYASSDGINFTEKQSFVYASYIDDPLASINSNGRFYYHSNAQFSISKITDSNQNVVTSYAYNAYGDLQILQDNNQVDNSYTFTGRQLDKEAGLFYFRARYYDANLGQFISRDPIGYVDGMSLYRGYFAVNYLDWRGLGLFGKIVKITSWVLGDNPGDDYEEIADDVVGEKVNKLIEDIESQIDRVENSFDEVLRYIISDESFEYWQIASDCIERSDPLGGNGLLLYVLNAPIPKSVLGNIFGRVNPQVDRAIRRSANTKNALPYSTPLRVIQTTLKGTSPIERTIAQNLGTFAFAYGIGMAVVEIGCFTIAFSPFIMSHTSNNDEAVSFGSSNTKKPCVAQ